MYIYIYIYRIRLLYRAGFILVFPLPGWFGLGGRGLVQKMGRNRSRWLWEWFKRWAEMVQDDSGNFSKDGPILGVQQVQEGPRRHKRSQDTSKTPQDAPNTPPSHDFNGFWKQNWSLLSMAGLGPGLGPGWMAGPSALRDAQNAPKTTLRRLRDAPETTRDARKMAPR